VRRALVVVAIGVLGFASAARAQVPDPKAMNGMVLPVPDLPAGTVTVRVIRGNFDKNLAGQTVEFEIDGKRRNVTTNADGRAEVTGLPAGAKRRARATVDGEKLESQEAVVATTGLRIILVATDPEAEKRAAEDRALATAPPVKGIVVFGPESRIIAEMKNDQLNIYYMMQIVNSARTPVDIGGPLVFNLPREARGATVLDGSTPKATANGPRITVTGPFPPGNTVVEAAYELPYSGPAARFTQVWPAALPQVTVLVPQIGGLKISSPQISSAQEFTNEDQLVILGAGPGLAAGQSLSLEIAGLPHRSPWPRRIALAFAGLIIAAGFIGVYTAPRRQAA
jgi:hypothetical protein